MAANIQKVCDNVWRVQSHIQMLPAFGLPLTTAVVGTPAGLVLHSPVRFDDTLAEQITALGDPCAIVAPNLFHHLYAAGAREHFPDATVFGPEKLARKNKKLRDLTPLETTDAPWTKHLEPIRIEGIPSVREFAFFHHASGTLLVTDLVFNVNHGDGWISKLYLRWSGALGTPMQTKIWRWITKDRRAAGRSLERILELDIQRVIVGHGDVIERDAKMKLRHACAWMLSE